MNIIPAFCLNNNCRLVFPSGIALTNCKNITFSECSAVCPRCGSKGKIIDGSYYEFENKLFAFIFDSKDSALFNRITSTVKREISRDKSPKNIKKKLNKSFPAQRSIWDLIPGTKQEAYNFITLVTGIVGCAVAVATSIVSCTKEESKTVILNQYYSPQGQPMQTVPQRRTPFDSRSQRVATPSGAVEI